MFVNYFFIIILLFIFINLELIVHFQLLNFLIYGFLLQILKHLENKFSQSFLNFLFSFLNLLVHQILYITLNNFHLFLKFNLMIFNVCHFFLISELIKLNLVFYFLHFILGISLILAIVNFHFLKFHFKPNQILIHLSMHAINLDSMTFSLRNLLIYLSQFSIQIYINVGLIFLQRNILF